MNVYRFRFHAVCPIDAAPIEYDAEISTYEVLSAEDLDAWAENVKSGFHEDFADDLHLKFGGRQRMSAKHGRVRIETVRP